MTKKPSVGQILKIAANFVIPIVIVNAFLFYIGDLLGAFPAGHTAPNGAEVAITAVIVASIVGVLLSSIFYWIITLITKNASKLTLIVGYILLVISLSNPLSIEDGNIGTFIVLNLMHVVVGVPMIQAYSKLSKTVSMAEDQKKQ